MTVRPVLSYIKFKPSVQLGSLVPMLLITLIVQGCNYQNSAHQSGDHQSDVNQSTEHQSDVNQSTDHQSDAHQSFNTPKVIKVVSPDWGVAATLTAMGYPPIATGDIRVWHQWVIKPELPSSVTDLGIRYQPNAELVAQLPVDMVIDNYFYEHARNLYGDVPAESIIFASENKEATWEDYVKPTQKIGQLIDQPDAADTYIAQSRTQIEQAGQRLHQRYPDITKFAVVQFVDANNMRMYAKNSLFNVVLSMMGFELKALADGNAWGFTPIQLGDLAKLEEDVCLLVIEPLSPLTNAQLQKSLVWQRLGYGASQPQLAKTNGNRSLDNHSSRCMAKLKPVWIYGGMSSLTVLADNLATATLTGGMTE